MREVIIEVCEAINGDAGLDVNEKLAVLGAVVESVLRDEVEPTFHAQAVEIFMGVVRKRVGVPVN